MPVAPSRFSAPTVIAVLAVGAVLINFAASAEALRQLVSRWDQQEQYSYGYLVPLVSLWLLWSRRAELMSNIGTPSYAGVLLVGGAMILVFIGEFSAIFLLSQIGFILSLAGIVLGIGGYSLLRVALVPIAYLLFAVPLPYFIDARLTLELQLISTQLGVAFINLFQVPVYVEGNVIDLGTYKLQVVEACSGLRYLYPLLSLSFLAAYFTRGGPIQRTFIFLSGIPIAIVMNGLRIGTVGILVDRWGTRMAEGALHFLEGWVIFVLCALILTAEVALLGRFRRSTTSGTSEQTRPADRANPGTRFSFRPLPLVASVILLLACDIGRVAISGRAEINPLRTRFGSFPMSFNGWSGQPQTLDLDTEKALNADDYLMANYADVRGQVVGLFVAYYASQRKNESPHSPVVCLPGNGWLITQSEQRAFHIGNGVHPYSRVVIQNASTRMLVYYWFEERGVSIADEYVAKWRLLTDSIWYGRSDGALVRVATEIDPADEAGADRRLQNFMAASLPVLWSAYLPSRPETASPIAGPPVTSQNRETRTNG